MLPLPSQPVTTRWTTWLKASLYYAEHFEQVKSVVDEFDMEDAESIRLSQELFSNERVKTNLAFIKSNFSSIISGTMLLETKGLCIKDSMDIVNGIHTSLNSMRRKEFIRKMNAVLKRNPGYEQLIEICDVLTEAKEPSDNYVKSLTPFEITLFRFAPTTTSDVERSFSQYGNIFTQNRQSFTFENLQ